MGNIFIGYNNCFRSMCVCVCGNCEKIFEIVAKFLFRILFLFTDFFFFLKIIKIAFFYIDKASSNRILRIYFVLNKKSISVGS